MKNPPADTLCFVTSNAEKLREAEEILAHPLRGTVLTLEEIQTLDLSRLVRHKVLQAFRQLGTPLMVEDTSLVCAAWGGLPGPFIKFFLTGLGAKGLVRALEPFENKSAEALCGVGYHDGREVHYFEGRTAGTLVPPRGAGGFGWDPIFLPEGSARTFGEMTREEKNANSMRAQALTRLTEFLHGR